MIAGIGRLYVDRSAGVTYSKQSNPTANTGWSSFGAVSFRKELQDTVTFSATPTIDWDADTADNKLITLTADVTSSTFTATRPGDYKLIIKQDGTGGRTFAFPGTNINGNPPAPNTTASSTSVYEFYFDGTDYNFG